MGGRAASDHVNLLAEWHAHGDETAATWDLGEDSKPVTLCGWEPVFALKIERLGRKAV